MKKNELKLQKHIIKLLKKEGGTGHKWATEWTVGVPDLVLAHPKTGLVLAEVKLETRWQSNTTRMIKLTDAQQIVLRRYSKAGASVLVLVGITHGYFDLKRVEICCFHSWRRGLAVSRDGLIYNRHNPATSSFGDWLSMSMSMNINKTMGGAFV